jgi:hypothetical protein
LRQWRPIIYGLGTLGAYDSYLTGGEICSDGRFAISGDRPLSAVHQIRLDVTEARPEHPAYCSNRSLA